MKGAALAVPVLKLIPFLSMTVTMVELPGAEGMPKSPVPSIAEVVPVGVPADVATL